MAAAWQQIGDVLEANSRIRRFMFAQQIALSGTRTISGRLPRRTPARALTLTAPVHARVMTTDGGRKNARCAAKVSASAMPPALVSATMRRPTRPRSRMMRALPFDRTCSSRQSHRASQ